MEGKMARQMDLSHRQQRIEGTSDLSHVVNKTLRPVDSSRVTPDVRAHTGRVITVADFLSNATPQQMEGIIARLKS